MLAQRRLCLLQRRFYGFADWVGPELKLKLVGVELRHFSRFPPQTIQSVAFLIDDGEEFEALSAVEAGIGKKRGSGRFNRGQRSTKFVCNRIEQRRSQLFAFAGGLGAAEFF